MDFKKSYTRYIIAMMLVYLAGFALLVYTVFLDFTPTIVIKVILIVTAIVCAFWIIQSWISNTIALVFFRLKKYPIKTYNLYPLTFIEFKKTKLNFLFDSYDELYTTIAIEKIKWSREKVEKYRKDFMNIISILKKIHFAELIIPIVLGVLLKNLFLFLFLGCILIANICLWDLPESRISLPGIYIALKDSAACVYRMFRIAKAEVFDKTELYNYAQELIKWNNDKLMGSRQQFLEQIMIDSIYENRNYLSEKTEEYINRLLIVELVGKSPFYFKLMVLYAIYCLNKGDNITANILYDKIEDFCNDLYCCPNKLKQRYKSTVEDGSVVNFDIKEMASFDNSFTNYLTKANWLKKQKFKFKNY